MDPTDLNRVLQWRASERFAGVVICPPEAGLSGTRRQHRSSRRLAICRRHRGRGLGAMPCGEAVNPASRGIFLHISLDS